MNALLKPMLGAAAVLMAVAAVCAALLAATYLGTRDQIARSEQERLLTQLHALVPAPTYDNDLAQDQVQLSLPALNPKAPITAYRARRDGKPVAVILTAMTPDGYSGDIRLLIGIAADGRVAGVRVLEHRETPGLGDKVDLSRSDWILSFDGKSLDAPTAERWKVRKDGGVFDQFAGATITPRAVVRTVKQALAYFRQNQAVLFATPPTTADTRAAP